MGEIFRQRVRERYLDLLDWLDYRPDTSLSYAGVAVALILMMCHFVPSRLVIVAAVLAVAAALALIATAIAVTALLVVAAGAIEAGMHWARTSLTHTPQPVLQRRPQ